MPKLRSNINKNNSPGVREDLGSLGVPVGIRVRSEALLVATQAMFTPTAPDDATLCSHRTLNGWTSVKVVVPCERNTNNNIVPVENSFRAI